MRLRRKPSPWMVVLQRLAFTTLWNGFFTVFIVLTWPHRDTTPLFIQGILGLFMLIGLGILWDLAVRIVRTLAGKTAIVEVDRQPTGPGDTVQVRVLQHDLASLAALQIALVGENTVTQTKGNTTITRTGPCYRREISALAGDDLAGEEFDRTFAVAIPTDAPPGEVRWSILVGQQLKQGGVDLQSFPLMESATMTPR